MNVINENQYRYKRRVSDRKYKSHGFRKIHDKYTCQKSVYTYHNKPIVVLDITADTSEETLYIKIIDLNTSYTYSPNTTIENLVYEQVKSNAKNILESLIKDGVICGKFKQKRKGIFSENNANS